MPPNQTMMTLDVHVSRLFVLRVRAMVLCLTLTGACCRFLARLGIHAPQTWQLGVYSRFYRYVFRAVGDAITVKPR